MNEHKVLVNTDHLLPLIAAKHGFKAKVIFNGCFVLKAVTSKKLGSEFDRWDAFNYDLCQLGLDYSVDKLSNKQIELKIK